MCLAMPMKIVALDTPESGRVDLDGVQYPVDLSLIEDPRLGDHVIVHAGFAIEKLDADEADARLDLFRQMAEAAAAHDAAMAAGPDSSNGPELGT